ncbi:MAG: flagellar motor switch protein FliN [Planctomycetales bacterium 12-60-4]|nr:MAG: flagellar motor switch protein FliN [Planctomycetales bacterium 12-60-4]
MTPEEIEELLQASKGGSAAPAKPAPPKAVAPEPIAGTAPTPEPPRRAERTESKAAKLLEEAESALNQIDAPAARPFELEDLIGSGSPPEKCSIDLLRDVDLDLKIQLGRTHMILEDVLKLRKGSVVTLDKLAGDPVDLYVNGRIVARGEVLVLNDNFCVRIAELVGSDVIFRDS